MSGMFSSEISVKSGCYLNGESNPLSDKHDNIISLSPETWIVDFEDGGSTIIPIYEMSPYHFTILSLDKARIRSERS